jgi:hypothetical protein
MLRQTAHELLQPAWSGEFTIVSVLGKTGNRFRRSERFFCTQPFHSHDVSSAVLATMTPGVSIPVGHLNGLLRWGLGPIQTRGSHRVRWKRSDQTHTGTNAKAPRKNEGLFVITELYTYLNEPSLKHPAKKKKPAPNEQHELPPLHLNRSVSLLAEDQTQSMVVDGKIRTFPSNNTPFNGDMLTGFSTAPGRGKGRLGTDP